MKRKYRYAVALLFFVVLAAVVFRCALGSDHAFSASDANIGQLVAGRPQMVDLFSPSYGGYILGGVRSPMFSPYRFLQALIPPFLFNDLIAPFYLVLSSMLLLVYLRMCNRSWWASVFGAIAGFWLGSSTLSSAGHYGKLGAAMFFVASLVLLEKSIRTSGVRRLCWAMLCGATVGFMLLSQQDIGMLFGVVLAPYALFRLVQESFRKPLDWLITLIPIALMGVILSAGTALSAYKSSIVQASAVQESPEGKWNFITQWSFPPQEMANLVAPGFMGWKTGDPDAPYWGKVGQSAEWAESGKGFRNFRLDSNYLGLLPFIFAWVAVFMAIRKGENENRAFILFWSAMGLGAFVLACGKFTPLYRLVIELPLFGSIRAPIKFLHNLAIILGILSAFGMDSILSLKPSRKHATLVTAILGSLFALCTLILIAGSSAITQWLGSWGAPAPLIVKRMTSAAIYATGSGAILFLLLKKATTPSRVKIFCFVACLVLVVDSLYVTQHYFRADDVAAMKRGNAVFDYLKANQGDQRVFTFDRDGVYNQWIGVDFPLHGIKGFWFWQAPRLSQEYKDYLSHGSKNRVALLQSTSIKYALAPAGALNQLPSKVFKPVMFYRFGMDEDKHLLVQSLPRPEYAQDQVVFELRETLPRLSLFHNWRKVAPEQMNNELFSKKNDIMKQVLVDADLPEPLGDGFDSVVVTSYKHNSVSTHIETKSDAVLLFTQRFQPQWKAYVDGKETPVFRCNGLSMGMRIPSGSHEVAFKIHGSNAGSILQLLGLALSIIAGGILLKKSWPRKNESGDTRP